MSETATDNRLATFPRRDAELRVSMSTYEGNPYVSIRIFWLGMPTRKGVSVRLHELRKVIEALEEAERRAGLGRPSESDRGAR